jgi:hypothetical protein
VPMDAATRADLIDVLPAEPPQVRHKKPWKCETAHILHGMTVSL